MDTREREREERCLVYVKRERERERNTQPTNLGDHLVDHVCVLETDVVDQRGFGRIHPPTVHIGAAPVPLQLLLRAPVSCPLREKSRSFLLCCWCVCEERDGWSSIDLRDHLHGL